MEMENVIKKKTKNLALLPKYKSDFSVLTEVKQLGKNTYEYHNETNSKSYAVKKFTIGIEENFDQLY